MATLITHSEVQQAIAEHREARAAAWAAAERLEATLTDQQRSLYREYSDARTEAVCTETAILSALLLAHAGPLAPMLRVLIAHCMEPSPCDCWKAGQRAPQAQP